MYNSSAHAAFSYFFFYFSNFSNFSHFFVYFFYFSWLLANGLQAASRWVRCIVVAPTRATHASQYGSRPVDRGLLTAVIADNAHDNNTDKYVHNKCTVNNGSLEDWMQDTSCTQLCTTCVHIFAAGASFA